MSAMIQLRNVPDDLHRVLKARAALSGRSLSDYLIHEIRKLAMRPTVEELRARLNAHAPLKSNLVPAPTDAVRAERDSR